jgi:hypothetical protein
MDTVCGHATSSDAARRPRKLGELAGAADSVWSLKQEKTLISPSGSEPDPAFFPETPTVGASARTPRSKPASPTGGRSRRRAAGRGS